MAASILFVDDEAALLSAVKRNLGPDFELQTAGSGAQGLRILARNPGIQVVVADRKMPKMSGIEFIAEARKISPRAVYILLDGGQDPAKEDSPLPDDAVFRSLHKPCAISELQAAVHEAIQLYESGHPGRGTS